MDDLEDSKYAFGGSEYYNDFYNMKINTNAANKWKTYNQKSKFSKLLIYPDYNPSQSGRIVGVPYLNQEGTIVLKEIVSEGTSTGYAGVQDDIYSVASLVKVATDVSYVNPVLNIDSIDDYEDYPSSIIFRHVYLDESLSTQNSEDSAVFSINNSVSLFSVNISGCIEGDFDEIVKKTGLKEFPFSKAFVRSDRSNLSTLRYDNEDYTNKFGIFFDGLEGAKEVFLVEKKYGFRCEKFFGTTDKYYILGIHNSFVTLMNKDNCAVFHGTITLQITNANPISETMIEIHNFKLPSPILTYIGVDFTNEQKQKQTYDGFYPINDEVWQGQVYLNGATTNLVDSTNYNNLKLYSSSQPNSDLSGNSTILTDDDGNVSGLLLTLKIPGFKLFDSAGMKYFLESQQMVTLSSSQMVDTYNASFGINDGNGNYYLKEYFNENAKVGSQVVSGTITNAYNYVTTKPFDIKMNIGNIKFRYNPKDDDKFQLEVITKNANQKFVKSLYYINKPVDQWYNMAFYKTVLRDSSDDELIKPKVSLRFALNSVNGETSGQISSEPGEIFRCYVTDDSTIDGSKIEFNLGVGSSITNWKNTLFPSVNRSAFSTLRYTRKGFCYIINAKLEIII